MAADSFSTELVDVIPSLRAYARANQAAVIVPFILGGAMGPVTNAGAIAQAANGTLYVDDVAHLDATTQARLASAIALEQARRLAVDQDGDVGIAAHADIALHVDLDGRDVAQGVGDASRLRRQIA